MSETTTDNYKWFSLKTVSGQEKKAKAYIEQELAREKLSVYVRQVLIPLEKVVQLRRGKKVSVEKNFFPGYIFVEADILDLKAETKNTPHSFGQEVIATINSVPGVAKFLPTNDGPTPLRDSEIRRILGKVDELNEGVDTMEVPFMVGESVKVTDGPFNGFTGNIEGINEEKKKLKVIVKIFGRRTPLELNYMQVEKE